MGSSDDRITRETLSYNNPCPSSPSSTIYIYIYIFFFIFYFFYFFYFFLNCNVCLWQSTQYFDTMFLLLVFKTFSKSHYHTGGIIIFVCLFTFCLLFFIWFCILCSFCVFVFVCLLLLLLLFICLFVVDVILVCFLVCAGLGVDFTREIYADDTSFI